MRVGMIWTVAAVALLATTSSANAAGPSRATPAPAAQKLSVAGNMRAGTAIKRGNHLTGAALAIIVVAGAAAIGGIAAAASGGNSSSP